MNAWLDSIAGALAAAYHHPEFGPLLLGMLVGIALTEVVVRCLPHGMSTWDAERITRLVVFGVATCVTFSQLPTLRGFVLALLAGLSSPTLHTFASRWTYAKWPTLKPPALRE